MGKKRQPIYKVVAADARSPRDGKFIEEIGLYNPKTDPATIDILEDRALYWLGVGAQPTDTVKNLLSKKGILLKRELVKRGLSEQEVEIKLNEWKNIHEAKFAAELKKKEQAEIAKTKKSEKVEEGAKEVKGAASGDAEKEEKPAEE
jgi:small subunit ribosomal protein S16